MIRFPSEILRLIFNYLPVVDLLQCQLTNKLWYNASVELIYSNITLKPHQSKLYTRTISNSLHLSNYLKYIDVGSQFNRIGIELFCDEKKILSKLLQHCPNILELHATNPGTELWYQLKYASAEGQLPFLQRLPKPRSIDIHSYIFTILSFKNTLTTLYLCDEEDTCLSEGWTKSTMYQMILHRIAEFPNLQYLNVGHHTPDQFSIFDELIEYCQNLKSFSARLYPITEIETIKEPNKIIFQRNDIYKISCNWEMIKSDDQLNYIMYKFPNIRDLKILYDPYADKALKRGNLSVSFDGITNFLNYALSIPKLEFEFYLEKYDLINVWIQFMKKEDTYRKVTIAYLTNYRDLNTLILRLEAGVPIFRLPIGNHDTTLPHIDFLTRTGNYIHSLTIESIWETQCGLSRTSEIYNQFKNEDWICRVLQLCPLLQELTLSSPILMMLSQDFDFKHKEMKSFKFSIFEPGMSYKFLTALSYNLPNLKQLRFDYQDWFETGAFYHVKIHMPYTNFDLITFEDVILDENTQYIIKLRTAKKESFFLVVEQDEIFMITEQTYKEMPKLLSFDITCQKIKEFRVLWREEPGKTRCKMRRWDFHKL